MKLGQAVQKLSLTNLWGLNNATGFWEKLPIPCVFPPDRRVVGRSVSFYDRRLVLTPEEIPLQYHVICPGEFVTASNTMMIYVLQENINRNNSYLYTYTGLTVMGEGTIIRLAKQTAASGAPMKAVQSVVGSYPTAMERGFAGPGSSIADGVYNTRIGGFVPSYVDVKTSDNLEFDGDTYIIDEVMPDLRLKYLQLTKR